jgi:alkyl sulfatase BDS1-like metallo-beta-lactamase superfamily hydrolase
MKFVGILTLSGVFALAGCEGHHLPLADDADFADANRGFMAVEDDVHALHFASQGLTPREICR